MKSNTFQRARSEDQIADRQNDILQACKRLYDTVDFEEITIKSISEMTSLTRSSIYNYYRTREEIFLDLLKHDYLDWYTDLNGIFDKADKMEKNEFCSVLTKSLVTRERMLKLLSILLTSLENQCSLEKLTEFKRECYKCVDQIGVALDKFFPSASVTDKKTFHSAFMVFLHGVYPYTHLSEKQTQAMKNVGRAQRNIEFKELCGNYIRLIASNL